MAQNPSQQQSMQQPSQGSSAVDWTFWKTPGGILKAGTNIAALLTLIVIGAGYDGSAVKRESLSDIKNLTFKNDRWVRDSSVGCPRCGHQFFRQLSCSLEGTAGCGQPKLIEVTCYTKGVITGKMKWRCSAPRVITFPYRFRETKVWCGSLDYAGVNNPNSKVWDESTCGLVYSVDYVVNPYIFAVTITASCSLVAGVLLAKYLKLRSPPSEATTQVKNPKEEPIVLYYDPFNAWVWGTSTRPTKGSHSIGATPEAAPIPTHVQGGGRGEGAFQSTGPSLMGLSSRTSSGTSVTPSPSAAGHRRTQEGGGFGDRVQVTPSRKASKVVIDEDDGEGAFHWTGSSLTRLSSRTSSRTLVTPSPVISHSCRNFAYGSASRH